MNENKRYCETSGPSGQTFQHESCPGQTLKFIPEEGTHLIQVETGLLRQAVVDGLFWPAKRPEQAARIQIQTARAKFLDYLERGKGEAAKTVNPEEQAEQALMISLPSYAIKPLSVKTNLTGKFGS